MLLVVTKFVSFCSRAEKFDEVYFVEERAKVLWRFRLNILRDVRHVDILRSETFS